MNDLEFIKIAYSKGKVQDVSQAFEEFPPEQEWHGGKIENVFEEENVQYGPYFVGDIVFVKKYKYADGTEGFDHFFVIISQNNIAVPIESFGMLLSSRLEKLKYKQNILLSKDEQNGLRKDSIVKTDILYKIENEQILFKIGKVDMEKIEKYKQRYLESLQDESI